MWVLLEPGADGAEHLPYSQGLAWTLFSPFSCPQPGSSSSAANEANSRARCHPQAPKHMLPALVQGPGAHRVLARKAAREMGMAVLSFLKKDPGSLGEYQAPDISERGYAGF